MLPIDHPDAPKYWMAESSGVLKPVVHELLHGGDLDANEIRLMKAYLWQWVSSPAWAPSGMLEALRLRVMMIQTTDDIHDAIRAAVNMEMDPL